VRSSYNWFITDGDWDEEEIALSKADLFFEEIGIKSGDRMLLSSMIPTMKRTESTLKE
jgi:hypothetical protein